MKFAITALRGPATGCLHEVTAELELQPLGRVVLNGGPTGYESFYADLYVKSIETRLKNRAYERGNLLTWIACLGTPGRYDRMIVPHDQMKAAFKAFGIEVPREER